MLNVLGVHFFGMPSQRAGYTRGFPMKKMLRVLISAVFFLPAAKADLDPSGLLAPNTQFLTAAEVNAAINAAAHAVNDPAMVIAVTDRQGNPLAVYRKTGAPITTIGNFSQIVDANNLAVNLARTAAFFSNSQAPLSSRTVRYISGVHFPPGIMFVGNAALYGIENTNRGCGFNTTFDSALPLPPARSLDRAQPGLGVITGKKDLNDSDPLAVNPGGVPLFKGNRLVGGIGVVASNYANAEYAAFVGATSPSSNLFQLAVPPPALVLIDSIALPFVTQSTPPQGTAPVGSNVGLADMGEYIYIPRVADYQTPSAMPMARIALRPRAGQSSTNQPQDSPGPVPEGYLVNPRDAAPGAGGLTAADVSGIITQTIATGDTTRAVIRLPLGTRAKFEIAVTDLQGNLIGLYRMKDATIFSADVAVSKARNVVYFSGPTRTANDLPGVPMGTAVTNRTISFGAQPFFPPGIDYTPPGPFFNLYKFDTLNPCTQGDQAPNPNQSGIVFFPGAVPLYRNGQMIGGLGVSGDGVEQDDFATNGGAVNFPAPTNIRADQILIRGVRLPYLKFPRNPTD